ncbi:MAG: glycosyltransferase family 2 protein [Herpetosiphonaceae bacterium]|nr:glycosyltransferase family 2 protein [Herpetosiphonaceae bacterium]
MRVATILVNWNQTDLTLDCLESLSDAGVEQPTIWVVDNGSQPPAAPALHGRFPAINIITLPTNCGFTGGNNVGVRAVLKQPFEALFLLNNDAVVEPATLPALIAGLQAHPTIAAVSPKVYYAVEGKMLQSVGLAVDRFSGRTTMLGSNQPDVGQYEQPADREALFGCAMLIRSAAWQQIGEFWEPFFNYAEETDWCLRARAAGWRLVYQPAASVRHRTSSSLGWNAPLKVYLIARNQLWLRQRNAGTGWRRWRGALQVAAQYARMGFGLLRRRRWQHALAIWLGIWDYWWGRTGNTRTATLQRR